MKLYLLTDIGSTPINVVVVVVKRILKSRGCVEHVSRRGMKHSFGAAGRTRGVQYKERVLAGHPFHVACKRKHDLTV